MLDYKIEVFRPNNKFYIDQCLKIAYSYHVDNGGFLGYRNAVKDACDYVICAVHGEEVLGYLGVNFNQRKELVIVQTAVKEEYKRQGIATELLLYLKHHSLGFEKIVSFVDKQNQPSIKMHLHMDFRYQNCGPDIFFEMPTKFIEGNEILQETTEKELED